MGQQEREFQLPAASSILEPREGWRVRERLAADRSLRAAPPQAAWVRRNSLAAAAAISHQRTQAAAEAQAARTGAGANGNNASGANGGAGGAGDGGGVAGGAVHLRQHGQRRMAGNKH